MEVVLEIRHRPSGDVPGQPGKIAMADLVYGSESERRPLRVASCHGDPPVTSAAA